MKKRGKGRNGCELKNVVCFLLMKKRQLPFSILIKLYFLFYFLFFIFRNTCNHQFALVWPLQYLEFLAEAGAVDDGCNQ